MEATVTIICGMILALGQGWLNLRLKQQDDARDAARAEQKIAAEALKLEAEKMAAQVAERTEMVAIDVARKVEEATAATDLQLGAIHVLVNTRMTEALTRIQMLEAELAELKPKAKFRGRSKS
jgi:hypothetical protein